jgi:7,8-dihydropterin-6-yl-methyl-4-(beta-D-ribofuranosyl)aminobenzene 5'-phosphate synthase
MGYAGVKLRPARRVEITVLVDNYSDVLLTEQKGVVRRPRVLPRGPLAEHGLSLLVRVFAEDRQHAVLLDTGLSDHALFFNAKLLQVDLTMAEALVLSHGHWDHLGGLERFLGLAGEGLKIVVHPDAFNAKRLSLQDGAEIVDLPRLSKEALIRAGADLDIQAAPSTLAGDMIVVLGEVARQTSFEKGFPAAQALVDGDWRMDPLRDDQGLAVVVEGKGLVVISGCAHAGIINTILHAQKVTGEKRLHAVLGGFHLTGPYFQPVVDPTIEALSAMKPDWLVPMHCTGWSTCNRFAQMMPEAFLVNTVGTTYRF